jgi:hypothetical protein
MTGKWHPGMMVPGNGCGCGPAFIAAQHKSWGAMSGTSPVENMISVLLPVWSEPETATHPVAANRTWRIISMRMLPGIGFAPGLIGTCQDSEGGGGRHCSSPSMNGSHSCRGSELDFWRRLSAGRPRFAPRETSCSIGQPLPLGTDYRAVGTLQIVNSERDSVVVPEIELGSVAMQMCLANVEIAAVDTALEDREEVLDRVGVPERASDVFLRTVVDRAVAGELVSHRPIDRCIVSHQIACLVHVRGDDRLQGPLR